MSRRPQPQMIDYMVIAINPALIMVLIGSLIYFVLEMFYQGEYPERLHFCLTLFIFAAVLISRISMEEGWDHAAPFGAALAIAICLAMHQFVSFKGTQVAAIGWLINYGLIALIWWCAIQLTWDCTLVDESQDASGEGLLQTVGLEHPQQQEQKTTDKIQQDSPEQRQVEPSKTKGGSFEDDLAWSTKKKNTAEEKSWWDRFLERRRRPHSPGVWVVYFSLAALPIFGIGQAFIPPENGGSRRYSFELLCVYVACALGLLLTTSFLGLRRYLRQRRLEMPAPMAGTWLVTGAVLIVGLLLLTALLPRPHAEYAISQLPFVATSDDRDSSQMAQGKEGTKDDQAKSAPGKLSRPEQDQSGANQEHSGSGEEKSLQASKGKSGSEESKTDNAKSSGGNSGESKSGSGKSGDSGSKGEQSSDSKEGKSNDQSSGDQKSDEKSSEQGKSNSSQSESDQSKPEKPQSGEQPKSEPQQAEQAPSQTPEPDSTPAPPDLSSLTDTLAGILKWIFYGAIVLISLWWCWKHRAELLAWLQNLFGWGSLFGRKKSDTKLAPVPVYHKSFYDFTDPFASGAAGQYPPAELIRYTFEAFEAWGRDNGLPRDADQTAFEFARYVGGKIEPLAKPSRALAELYSRAAYAPGTLPAASVEHLRSLWEAMRATSAMNFGPGHAIVNT